VVAVIGMATLDYLYVVDDYPRADAVTPAVESYAVVGGAAGRGAIAAARLGAAARLLASCGAGVHAEALKAQVETEGVECTWVAYDQPSQHSAVVVARRDATRTIIWLPQPMADARMVERLPEFLEGADVALVDSTDGVLAGAALDECERRGIVSVLDTGSGRPWTRELARRADHVIAPEKYVLKETGLPAEEAGAELWRDSRCAVLGVTQGARGGFFTTGEGRDRLRRWSAPPVKAVDVNGAGDTFHGAYAWALAAGLPLVECFAVAAWAAALKVTQVGNAAIPTLAGLEATRLSRGPRCQG
jgi:sugar/nucleoside kinase (ribokinase family)